VLDEQRNYVQLAVACCEAQRSVVSSMDVGIALQEVQSCCSMPTSRSILQGCASARVHVRAVLDEQRNHLSVAPARGGQESFVDLGMYVRPLLAEQCHRACMTAVTGYAQRSVIVSMHVSAMLNE
jgi:hypothetical protein